MVEQPIRNRQVASSTLALGSTFLTASQRLQLIAIVIVVRYFTGVSTLGSICTVGLMVSDVGHLLDVGAAS